jgi:hypothetical protein
MIVLQIAGWLLMAASARCAFRFWHLDRQMQRFRVPDGSAAAYMFVPIRWQRRLYTPEAHPLVTAAWKATAAMYALAIPGVLLIAIGSM